MPVARWMAACAEHYYAHGDPFGRDFTTAPEISQVFGELVGLWLADLWLRAGRPDVRLVELGPGRGTLMADALRAGARAGFEPPVALVETSARLRAEQAVRVPGSTWHATLAEVPDDRPLLLIANEFLDALPVRQLVRAGGGWRERCVGWDGDRFLPVAGNPVADALVPAALVDADEGAIVELMPAADAVVAEVTARLVRRGGAALFIDYARESPALGSSLQAIRAGRPADPFATPGEADVTCHVDFTALAADARGVSTWGPVEQGAWLGALGVGPRTEALARARPEAAERLRAASARLTSPAGMGALFKALALTGPGWPRPEGF